MFSRAPNGIFEVYHLGLFKASDLIRMHKPFRALGLAMLLLGAASCRLIYVPDVQQGNLLDKKAVDQLKPGLTKHQVLSLLGSPSVVSPFERDQWDYVSTQQHRGGPIQIRTLTLTFKNNTMVSKEGDFFAENATQMLKDSKKYHATYPVDETEGDKGTKPKDDKGGKGN